MAVQSINSHEWEACIQNNDVVFLDFWASWCAPCKVFAKTFETVAQHYPHILFAKVNIEQETQLAELFHIQSIPHLMVFKQGIAIYSEAGSMPESTLKELVQQAIDVDVSGIREQLNETE